MTVGRGNGAWYGFRQVKIVPAKQQAFLQSCTPPPMDKPKAPKRQTLWLQVDELALLVESARTLTGNWKAIGRKRLPTFAYEILVPHVQRLGRRDDLVFTTASDAPIGDWRKILDVIPRAPAS